jgi:NADPH-dependent ferric siderophore reductase
MCGVKAMLDDVRTILRGELGLPRQRVHAESYG